eukprot:3870487-Rhodomonas_salina.1
MLRRMLYRDTVWGYGTSGTEIRYGGTRTLELAAEQWRRLGEEEEQEEEERERERGAPPGHPLPLPLLLLIIIIIIIILLLLLFMSSCLFATAPSHAPHVLMLLSSRRGRAWHVPPR